MLYFFERFEPMEVMMAIETNAISPKRNAYSIRDAPFSLLILALK